MTSIFMYHLEIRYYEKSTECVLHYHVILPCDITLSSILLNEKKQEGRTSRIDRILHDRCNEFSLDDLRQSYASLGVTGRLRLKVALVTAIHETNAWNFPTALLILTPIYLAYLRLPSWTLSRSQCFHFRYNTHFSQFYLMFCDKSNGRFSKISRNRYNRDKSDKRENYIKLIYIKLSNLINSTIFI